MCLKRYGQVSIQYYYQLVSLNYYEIKYIFITI